MYWTEPLQGACAMGFIGEWESTSRGRAVGNDGNEHDALYCGVCGGLGQGKLQGAWLTAKGFECGRTTPLLELDSHEFLERASWMRARASDWHLDSGGHGSCRSRAAGGNYVSASEEWRNCRARRHIVDTLPCR